MQIIIVQTQRHKKLFLEFPWQLYKNDPIWVPPLQIDQKENVNYKRNPFYNRNEIQTFLAEHNGKIVGRIAAIVNYGHVERYDEQTGFFGFFECIDDQETATALFSAAWSWLKEKGMTRIRGPVNPSLNATLGLLISGFDTPPTFMMTYNPPYYEKLVENFGFRKTHDLYAFLGKMEHLPQIQKKLLPICGMIREKTGVVTRTLDRKHFAKDVEQFLNVYNQSLSGTWGFVPMSRDELNFVANGLKYLIVPELAIALELDGKLIGASFCLPDYNPRIKAINGRLFPFGFATLLWRKNLIKKVRIISTNVLPEYQMQGLGLVLLDGLLPKALEWGIHEGEFSWVLESNQFSKGSLEKGGAKLDKTYRVYDFPTIGQDSLKALPNLQH